MGENPDSIQKRSSESSPSETVTHDVESATEALSPPALQFKSEPGIIEEEGISSEYEKDGAFQFSLAGPPEKPDDTSSKVINSEVTQKKGVAEPFKMPIVQKKEVSSNIENTDTKASFKP